MFYSFKETKISNWFLISYKCDDIVDRIFLSDARVEALKEYSGKCKISPDLIQQIEVNIQSEKMVNHAVLLSITPLGYQQDQYFK